MAGIHFSFDNFEQLLRLNIGISDRLDENRAESFTLLYCDFSGIEEDIIKGLNKKVKITGVLHFKNQEPKFIDVNQIEILKPYD